MTEEDDGMIYVVKGVLHKALWSPSPFVYNTFKQGKRMFLTCCWTAYNKPGYSFLLLQLGRRKRRAREACTIDGHLISGTW